MPNIQDLSLEIQEMIVKHLNTPGFCNCKWLEFKLYKNHDAVKMIFPYFEAIEGNVALRYSEPWRPTKFCPFWLKHMMKKEPWVITTSKPPNAPEMSDDDY